MFTGIVQDVGEIASIIPREGDVCHRDHLEGD